MSNRIKLVQGDTLPFINLTLIDSSTNTPLDLSDSTISVHVFFRKEGESTVLSTIPCSKVDGGNTGKIKFNFANGELNVDAGNYEAEIEVNFDSQTQTIYDVLKFTIREQFN